MANITESSTFPANVYEIATSDPVVGGTGGISNVPHEQLTKRTRYLKDTYEAHVANTGDPHAAAGYGKAQALADHITDVDDPHAAAGYQKHDEFQAHVDNINDPHAAAGYNKQSEFDAHVENINDPHAAAGYAKESSVDDVNQALDSHIGAANPHVAAGYLKSIPIASSTVLGGIKVGGGLSISEDGTLSNGLNTITAKFNNTQIPVTTDTQLITNDPVPPGTYLVEFIVSPYMITSSDYTFTIYLKANGSTVQTAVRAFANNTQPVPITLGFIETTTGDTTYSLTASLAGGIGGIGYQLLKTMRLN